MKNVKQTVKSKSFVLQIGEGETSTASISSGQARRIDEVAVACGVEPAELLVAFALGMIDQADTSASGTTDNAALFQRHLDRFSARKDTPARPALPRAVSGRSRTLRERNLNLDMKRDTLRRIRAVAAARGITADAWLREAITDIASGVKGPTAKASRSV